MSVIDQSGTPRPRRPLFYKYFVALFVAVVVPLTANGMSEAPDSAVQALGLESHIRGHEDRFLPPMLSARCVMRQQIVAATRGNGRDAP